MRSTRVTYWSRFVVLVLVTCCQATPPGWIDGIKLQKVIENLVESSLGRTMFENELNNHVFTPTRMDGQILLDKYVSHIGSRINNSFDAVRRLKHAVEEGYMDGSFTGENSVDNKDQCCKTSDQETPIYSGDWKTEVITSDACVRFAEDSHPSAVVPNSKNLLHTMMENKNIEAALKWQYYGTEEGMFVKYPRQKDAYSCNDYDPRHRPWYAEAAATLPKDVVIVFDRSGSIKSGGLMPLVKSSAITILDTLNADDRVALVAFNEKVSTPPGETGKTCFYNHLAIATPENKAYLSSWVDKTVGVGLSQYDDALKEAFAFFKISGDVPADPRQRRKVIVFISDGQQAYSDGSDDKILQLLRQKNGELNNSVVITTYGIGNDMSITSQNLFKNMSNQTLADPAKGKITPGEFIWIKASTNIRSNIAYYTTLSDEANGQPIISTPYVDFSGLGLVVSICLSVHPNMTLLGVVCIDISLTEIAAEAISLHNGNNAYVFIVDYKSRTIIHPLMPDALNYDRVVYLDIKDLERNPDVGDILNNMRQLLSGSRDVMTKFIKARGNTTTDGVEMISLQAHYYYKQIGTANFSLAVVTTDTDVDIAVESTSLRSRAFIYHRIDFVDDIEKCVSHGRISTNEHAVVKFTEKAFINPATYTNTPDTSLTAYGYRVYMEAKDQNDHRDLKLLTKQMVAISEGLETIWKELSGMDDIVVWRYYGDYYGHVRIYPGLTLPKMYDHTQRAFFWKTVSNVNTITITPPYLDAFGAGIVATVSVPIFRPGASVRRTKTSKNAIIGVLALDVKMSYITYRMQEMFPACLEEDKACFIMDTSGYLVYHSDISYNDDDKESEYDGYHIAELEPDVSTYLIAHSHMINNDCVDFGYKQTLRTWKVTLQTPIHLFDRTPYFDMVRISGTNLYLGIKHKRFKTPCDCPNRNASSYGETMYQCNKHSTGNCACPCVEDAEYDHCKNQFLLRSDGSPTCYPQPVSIGFQNPISNEKELIAGLGMCFLPNCSVKTTESSCHVLTSCRWCPTATICISDICPVPTKPSMLPLIIGMVIAVVVVLILILVVLLYLRRKGKLGCCGGPRVPQPGNYVPDLGSEYSCPPKKNAAPIHSPSGDDNVVWNVRPDVVIQRSCIPMTTIGDEIRVLGRDHDDVFNQAVHKDRRLPPEPTHPRYH